MKQRTSNVAPLASNGRRNNSPQAFNPPNQQNTAFNPPNQQNTSIHVGSDWHESSSRQPARTGSDWPGSSSRQSARTGSDWRGSSSRQPARTGSDWRGSSSMQLTRAGSEWHGSSSRQRSTNASQAPFSPIIEERSRNASQVPCSLTIDDGFTLVSRPKAPSAKPQAASNRPLKSQATNTIRSDAAVRRADAYEGPTPKKSHYKQSCLPVEERDPVLVEVERNKGLKLPKESFKPGTIFRAVLHEPDFKGVAGATNFTEIDRFRTTDTVHGPIYTKTRKMIVLATFQDNYIAVPIYTHNGRGLEGKTKPEEFVSVRDHRARGPFTQLSVHRPLVTEHLNEGIEPFHVKAAVHITYPVSRKYTLPVVQEGRLKKESVELLASLFSDHMSQFLGS